MHKPRGANHGPIRRLTDEQQVAVIEECQQILEQSLTKGISSAKTPFENAVAIWEQLTDDEKKALWHGTYKRAVNTAKQRAAKKAKKQ